MNKLILLSSFFLCLVAAVKPVEREYRNAVKTINDDLSKKQGGNNSRKFNLRESIDYERKNNYELYTNISGELKQHRYGVDEPRQVLKKNSSDIRYLVNDLEVIFGVYKFSASDKEKVLRETLKPESLCFTILGLLSNKINEINVSDASVYGFLIEGDRSSNNHVINALNVNIILSNITVPLGVFSFPEMKNAPYQIPFLVGHYDRKTNFKNSAFSYLCPLPTFLIDVIKTTSSGLKFNFNDKDLNVEELFPATLSYALSNKDMLPTQKEDKFEKQRAKLLTIVSNIASEIPLRKVKNNGAEGKGVSTPKERLLVNESFFIGREIVKDFVSKSGKVPMNAESIGFYFLVLSQNLKFKLDETKYVARLIKSIKIQNVKVDKNENLISYTIQLEMGNGKWISTDAVVNKKNIVIPKEVLKYKEDIVYTVPFSFGLVVSKNGKGIDYRFTNTEYHITEVLPYNVTSLAAAVSNN